MSSLSFPFRHPQISPLNAATAGPLRSIATPVTSGNRMYATGTFAHEDNKISEIVKYIKRE